MDISLLLTIIGSLGGFILIWEVFSKSWKYFIKAKMSFLASEKDFMYKRLEIGERIIVNKKHILQRRVFTLKALQENVTSLRIRFGPLNLATIDVKLILGDGILRPIETLPPNGDWLDFSLDFGKPLRKNEVLDFIIEAELKVKKGKIMPNSVYFTTNRRTENLCLRVVFCNPQPTITSADTIDIIGNKIQDKPIYVDDLTREAKWNIEYPKPGVMYNLNWFD